MDALHPASAGKDGCGLHRKVTPCRPRVGPLTFELPCRPRIADSRQKRCAILNVASIWSRCGQNVTGSVRETKHAS